MKKKLQKMLDAKKKRLEELAKRAAEATDINILRGIQEEIDNLKEDIASLQEAVDAADITEPDEDMSDDSQSEGGEGGQGSMDEQRGEQPRFNVTRSYQAKPAQAENVTDPADTIEYRQAFMRYVQTGEVTPALNINRAGTPTLTTDVGKLIPTTIMNEVLKESKVYGSLFARVRKLNIQGGVEFPISSLTPTATWLASETAVSDGNKIEVKNSVMFAYHTLELRIQSTLLASITTLAGFEAEITRILVEAMAKAIETAIIAGTGSKQPLGITKDPRVTKTATLAPIQAGSWAAWHKEVFAKIPLAKRAGGLIMMAAGTFEQYINGMVDANGQRVGYTDGGITDGIQERFGGKEVLLVEDDLITPFDSASKGDVIGIFFNPNDYAINSNMQLTYKRYFNDDTNMWTDKALLIADGKILDASGVLLIKKGEDPVAAG